MSNLQEGFRFRFPLANLGGIANKDIRRLAIMGVYFVIFDVELCIEAGIFKAEKDVLCITTGLDYHGKWKFERKDLEELLNVYKGRS